MLRIDDADLHKVQKTLADARRGTPKAMAAAASAVSAEWQSGLAANAGTKQQTRLIVSGASVDVSGTSFELHAARSGALSGGLDASHWYAVDYGMRPARRLSGARRALIWVGRNLPAVSAVTAA